MLSLFSCDHLDERIWLHGFFMEASAIGSWTQVRMICLEREGIFNLGIY